MIMITAWWKPFACWKKKCSQENLKGKPQNGENVCKALICQRLTMLRICEK